MDRSTLAIRNAQQISEALAHLSSPQTQLRKNAAWALWDFSMNAENKVTIAKTGAIPLLVDLLRDTDTEVRENAAWALHSLAVNVENRVTIAQAGAVLLLVPLLYNTNFSARRSAAAALRNLAMNAENKITIAKAGAIPHLTTLLRDPKTEVRISAVGALQNLALNAENQLTIAKADAIPPLVTLLQDANTEVREGAAGTLWNLTLSSENDITIAKAGAIRPLLALLTDPDTQVRASATGALENLALNAENKITIEATKQAIEQKNQPALKQPQPNSPPPPPAAPNASTQIPPNQLSFNPTNPATQLGEGGFGIVYRGQYTPVQGDVAIKALHPFRGTPTAAAELKQEAALMARLTSDYIVRFYGFSQWTDDRTLLVMEYCPSGSLFDYLHPEETTRSASANDLSWSMRYYLAQDITRGLDYLHSQRPMIIHRDLKSHNVLLTLSPEGRLQAKLSDFGLAKMKNESSSQSRRTQSAAGTVAWMAPELLIEDEDDKVASANTRTDIYALGIVFWELASGEIPFGDKKIAQIIGLLVQGKRPKIPKSTACDTRFSDLIQRCWDQRPHSRPSAQDVVQKLGPLLNLYNRGASAAEAQPRTTPNSFFSRLRSSFSGSSKKAAGTHDSTLFSR